jgi:hypothetical protein
MENKAPHLSGLHERCRCGKVGTQGLHPCPYAEEIFDEPEPVCYCCDDCTAECAIDI